MGYWFPCSCSLCMRLHGIVAFHMVERTLHMVERTLLCSDLSLHFLCESHVSSAVSCIFSVWPFVDKLLLCAYLTSCWGQTDVGSQPSTVEARRFTTLILQFRLVHDNVKFFGNLVFSAKNKGFRTRQTCVWLPFLTLFKRITGLWSSISWMWDG